MKNDSLAKSGLALWDITGQYQALIQGKKVSTTSENFSENVRLHSSSKTLRVGGFVPLTTTDMPGMLSAVIFCQGCPWQCRYCHNTHLIPTHPGTYDWKDIVAFLKKRRGLLDAVVFSGGEPTMQPVLIESVRELHALGFNIGLHTAGQYTERLRKLIPYLSWVGFDLKAPFGSYEKVTQRKSSTNDHGIQESLQLLIDANVPLECRTTVHGSLLGEKELLVIAHDASTRGVKKYVLQRFRAEGCTDNALVNDGTLMTLSSYTQRKLEALFDTFEVRG